MKIWTVYILSLAMLLSGTAYAAELRAFYQGIRPLGMGGAFTAVADDENAMFYNPAGLNSIKGIGGLAVFNPYAEVSKNFKEFYQDLTDVADASNDTEQSELAAQLLDDWLGEHVHLRAGMFPNVAMHNFGLGVLAQAAFDGEVHNPLGINTLQVRGGYDLALVASGAYGFTVMDNPLMIGVTGKVINRRFLDQTYTTTDLVQEDGIDATDDFEKGKGLGVDLGVIYSLPVFLEPAFGLSIQNIGDVNMGVAGTLEQQLNLGVAIHPAIGFGKWLVAFDMIDITNQVAGDNDLAKRLNLGVEYKLPVILALRAGLHQGYPSYGLAADLWFVEVSYAHYTEEIGAYAGQRPERRNMAQVSFGF